MQEVEITFSIKLSLDTDRYWYLTFEGVHSEIIKKSYKAKEHLIDNFKTQDVHFLAQFSDSKPSK